MLSFFCRLCLLKVFNFTPGSLVGLLLDLKTVKLKSYQPSTFDFDLFLS